MSGIDERVERDLFTCERQLAIVEKYEHVVNYLYPIGQSIPRAHGVLREKFLSALLDQAKYFIDAGKSSQVSKLYAADAGLATLRFYLRLMVHKERKLLSPRQHEVASSLLAEVGKMLHAWKESASRKPPRHNG